MADIECRTRDEYIATQPEATRNALQQVRSTIRRALPEAEKVISYKMPAYRLHGEVVLYFAAWKRHYSSYPAGERMLDALKDKLTPYKVGKGTIQFQLSDPVPSKLIEEIIKFRVKETAGR